MTENQAPGAEQNAGTSEKQPVNGSSSQSRLVAAAVISIVIVVESVIAYLLVPTAAETAAMAHAISDSSPADDLDVDTENTEKNGNPVSEIPLGEFHVSAYQPVSNTTLRIDVELVGIATEGDESEVLLALERVKHRFREQVIVTMRSVEVTDLTEPGLGLIKRRILEKSNGVFGKPLLQDIVFSDFSFVEQ